MKRKITANMIWDAFVKRSDPRPEIKSVPIASEPTLPLEFENELQLNFEEGDTK